MGTPHSPAVADGNPCPFLRAAVASGHLDGHRVAPADVGRFVADASGAPDGARRQAVVGTAAVALVGNGLWPWDVVRSVVRGARLDELRDGPLDKHGVGSRIIRPDGTVDEAELDRLAAFAQERQLSDGSSAMVLDSVAIEQMMDANLERSRATSRAIDRKLMDGEWPVLLRVIGRDAADGTRVLAVDDVRRLVEELRLPDHVEARLHNDTPRCTRS